MAKPMNILLSEELIERISEMSREEGISRAEFIRRALDSYIRIKEKERKRREIQRAIAIQDQLRCAEAVEIAYKKELTVYDSYFIALAHKLDCKLITADEKLYERASDIPWVISLSEL